MVAYLHVGSYLSQVRIEIHTMYLKSVNISVNLGYLMFFGTFRNVDPPIWYDTDVKLFEVQHVQHE